LDGRLGGDQNRSGRGEEKNSQLVAQCYTPALSRLVPLWIGNYYKDTEACSGTM